MSDYFTIWEAVMVTTDDANDRIEAEIHMNKKLKNTFTIVRDYQIIEIMAGFISYI